jgi:phosphate transport system permease protein
MKTMTGQQDTTIINSNPDSSGKESGSSEKQASRNANLFTETPLDRGKRLAENMAKGLFLLMTLLMVIPLILIVAYLFYKAFPVLSFDFLFTNPTHGMRAGGIWAALLGTIYLVMISLLVSAPIGVLAAVYLNEYARENWLTRIINLAW